MKLLKQSSTALLMSMLLLGLGLLTGAANAANYVVGNTNGSGAGSLREAVDLANADGTTSTITFNPTVFAAPRKTIIAPPSINITQDVTITGPAAGVVLLSQTNYNIFTVSAGISASFIGLTLTNGNTGVENNGTVTLTNCTLNSNSFGLLNYGSSATLINCTISGNGDGLQNGSGGSGSGSGSGSVIGTLDSTSTVNLTNCTVTGNSTGINNFGTVTAKNTIVAGNSEYDTVGELVTDGGSNILEATATEAGLDPSGLQDNGGPAPTVALVSGSPAINAGTDADAPAKDQRGVTRPQGTHSDIGAYEAMISLVVRDVAAAEGDSGTTNFVFTVKLLLPAAAPVTVDYATANGTAAAGTDYTAKSGTITIPAGVTSSTITVAVKGDTAVEPAETFYVNLSNSTGAPIADGQGVGAINADDFEAPSLVVNTTSGVESRTDGVTSLPDAVAYANSDPEYSIITFDPAVFAAPRKTILVAGVLKLTESVNITGPAAGVAVEGVNNPNSIFYVVSGTDAYFNGLTISKGVYGILSSGETSVTNCTLSGNSDTGFYSYYGGATLTNCTLSGNNIGVLGTSGAVRLTNCTVAGNSFFGLTFNGTSANLTNCTVSGNNVGIKHTYNGTTVNLKNCIVAGNTTNTDGTFSYGAGNIATGTAAAAGLETDGTGQPLLKDNDGPTKTIALIPGGAAVDAASDADAPGTDQRGYSRPHGTHSDVGAFELAPLTLVINDVTASEGNSGTTDFVFTVKLLRISATDVTVGYATADGTATAGTDYTAKSGTVTIPAGAYAATITVPVTGNTTIEPTETFYLNLSNPTDATISDGQGVGTITTEDFEVPSLVVNTTSDQLSNTDGVNSLRDAIAFANSNPDSSTITFNIPVAQKTGSAWIIDAASTLVVNPNTATTITGPGAGLLTIRENGGNKSVALFEINGDTSLSGLTISGGSYAIANPSPAKLTLANCVVTGNGTGIYSRGIATLTNCTLTGNSTGIVNDRYEGATLVMTNCVVTGGSVSVVNIATATIANCTLGGTSSNGIVNQGTATVNNSTLSGIPGPGFLNTSDTSAILTNCTFSGNQIGVLNSSSSTLTLLNSTLTGNSNFGLYNYGTATVNNSLIVGNTVRNIDGSITSGSSNITEGTSAAAGLDPNGLKDNGGPTKTIALLASSPAIDAANDSNAPAKDQRGVTRPQGAHSDIGAYEFAVTVADTTAPIVNFTTSSTTPAGTTPKTGSTVYNTMPAITGVAADAGSGISRVQIRLYRSTATAGVNEYWNGTAWSATATDFATSVTPTGGGANISWSKSGGWPTGANLTDGTYYLRVLAYDKTNNTRAAVTNFVKATDVTIPVVSITTPPAGEVVKSLTPVAGTASDGTGGSGVDNVTVTLRRVSDLKYWNGTAWGTVLTPLPTTLTTTGWTKTTGLPAVGTNAETQLLEGKYTIIVTATDKAGKKSTAIRSDFTIDRTMPIAVAITSPAHLSSVKVFASAAGTATDNAGGGGIGRVDLSLRRVSDLMYWNGSAWGTAVTQLPTVVSGTNWTKNTGLPAAGENVSTQMQEGKYTLVTTAYDKAGNKATTTARSDFTVDRTLPTVAVTAPAHLSTVSALTTLSGTAFDAVSGAASVNLTLKRLSDNFCWTGTDWVAAVTTLTTPAKPATAGNATWVYGSATQPMPAGSKLADGTYLLSVRSVDKAGNLSVAASSRFTLKRTASFAQEPAQTPLAASGLQLSTASATADGFLRLTFTGPIDANTALDTTRYSLTRDGAPIIPESAQLTGTGTVLLGLEENGVSAGDHLQISFNLKDATGRPLTGQAAVIVR